MNPARTVPLSWAQRAWMLGPPTLTESDGWRHDLGATVAIPRHVDVGSVEAALATLIRTYPALRARLVPGPDGVLRQEIASTAPAGVRIAPAELDPVRTAAVARGAASSANIGAAVQYDGPGTKITLAMAHAFVDGWAVGLLRGAFEQVLGGASCSEQETLYQLLEFERSKAGAELSRRNIRRLVTVATKADRLGLLAHSAGSSAQHGDLLAGIHDSTWLLGALGAVAPPSALGRAATLLSLLYLGYSRWQGTNGAVFVTPVANRVAQEQREFVGLMMMRNWVLLDWRPTEPFRELVARTTTQLLRCTLHGRFDPPAAADELDRAGITSSPRLYFNYAEPPGFVVPAQPRSRPETTQWRRLPSGGVPFEFNAYVGDDGVMVITKFDETLFPAPEAERFGSCLREIAAVVCREPDVVVSRMLDA